MNTTVAIIGGGPAGLSAAVHAARSGTCRVIVLERNTVAGRKLLITGGGRCNLTHELKPKAFQACFDQGARFLSYSLHEFPVSYVLDFFKHRGLSTRTEPDGCVFPETDWASDVRDLLVKEALGLGVQFQYSQRVFAINKKAGQFQICTEQGQLTADRVIIATGGMSYPKTGSTGDGYAWARALGHTVVTPRPSLVPLVISQYWAQEVAGVALDRVTLTVEKDGKHISVPGKFVFTQNGAGGFAAQNLSRYITRDLPRPSEPITVGLDCIPDLTVQQLDAQIRRLCQDQSKKKVQGVLSVIVPKRLARLVCRFCDCSDTLMACQLAKTKRLDLVKTLKKIKLHVIDTRSIEEATVTQGGVLTDQIDSKTMESKVCPGLYFAGEVLDVDGPCGGYHLQMCWSTGAVAGRAAAQFE